MPKSKAKVGKHWTKVGRRKHPPHIREEIKEEVDERRRTVPKLSQQYVHEIDVQVDQFTRAELAKSCLISKSHAQKILAGKRDPNIRLLKRMADFFGVTMDELWEVLGKRQRKYEIGRKEREAGDEAGESKKARVGR